ncbi:MAG: hypothetical protein ACRDG3_05310, partial [Tepidiformaceae bacterium]
MSRRHFPAALVAASFGLALFAAGLFSWQGGGAQPAHALTNCDTNEAGVNAQEQAMLDLMNQARAQ